MSKIAVLGPGGVGGLVAAALEHAGADVVVVARRQTEDVIGRRGIKVRSVALGSFSARPRVVANLRDEVDVLFVATKASGLQAALARIDSVPGLTVPLLNGLDHMGRLRSRFGTSRVAAGVIRVESDRLAPGEILQSSPSVRIDLAADDPALGDRVAALASALELAGIEARIGASESQVLWSKLARLNALALTTSASDRPIGFVRTDPRWRSALEGAIAETVAVANADGAELSALDTLAELDQAHAGLGSSMQRDIAAGREPELDAIAGAVLRAAARHGLRCPTVAWLAERVAARAGIQRR
ncbi:MAG: ketopantoate reductase family protein [Solirubrobacteraceae bacterium]